MKTKEFIKKVKELGFNIKEYSVMAFPEYDSFEILLDNNVVAQVYKNVMYSSSTVTTSFDKLRDSLKTNLYHLIRSYAETPVDERDEPKKYYLRHRWLKNKCKEQYLNIDKIYDSYFLLGNANTELYKTQFTEKEIEELKDKLDTDLADFEEVEVEE